MEKKLRSLFDYQRFENNKGLERLIRDTESRYSKALNDDDLFSVNAAGTVDEGDKKKDEE